MGSFLENAPALSAVTQILDAAIAEFGEHGIEATRMEDIAARAKLSKQLIYYYFRTKEGLYLEVIDKISADLHQPYLDVDFESLDPIPALEEFLLMVLDTNMNLPYLWMADQMLHLGENVKASSVMYTHGRTLVEILDRIIKRGQQGGDFGPCVDAPQIFLQIILLSSGFMNSKVVMSRYTNHDFQSESAAAAWREYVMRSMMATIAAAGA
jgi:TetR/AcrR family transcriptional regulator